MALAVTAMLPLQLAARPARPLARPEPAARVETPAIAADRDAAATQSAPHERRLNFVMFGNDRDTTMSGSTEDIRRARALRRGSERMLWFRQSGREYVVRDPALLAQVLDLWKPVGQLGDQQGVLGTRQGELGTRQGEIGTLQGVLGTEQGRVGTRQGRLGERQGVLAARETAGRREEQRAAIERERLDIEREMRALDREMRELDVKMRELDHPMRELDVQMQAIGKEMEVLGRKMEEASKRAEGEMGALLARAIASGVAVPVK
jgi:hypothetical protein